MLSVVLAIAAFCIASPQLLAEGQFRSANFIVTASSNQVAQRIAEAAEESRSQFAGQWLRSDLPAWDTPCRITVEERASGGQGWISYERFRGKADKIQICVSGNLDRIVEYVLPHEVAHAALAAAIGRSLPRWVDEGVALMCESESQQWRQRTTIAELSAKDRVLSLDSILAVVHYPEEHEQLVGFYASCFSLTEYLVSQGGRQRFLRFVKDSERAGWESSLTRHYGWNMDELEAGWRDSIRSQPPNDSTTVASAEPLNR